MIICCDNGSRGTVWKRMIGIVKGINTVTFVHLLFRWSISSDIICEVTEEWGKIRNTFSLLIYSAPEKTSCDCHKLYILINCLLRDLLVMCEKYLWSVEWEKITVFFFIRIIFVPESRTRKGPCSLSSFCSNFLRVNRKLKNTTNQNTNNDALWYSFEYLFCPFTKSSFVIGKYRALLAASFRTLGSSVSIGYGCTHTVDTVSFGTVTETIRMYNWRDKSRHLLGI